MGAPQVTSDRRVVAERVAGQHTVHESHGGVVPRLAAAAHSRVLPDVVRAYGHAPPAQVVSPHAQPTPPPLLM